jgi:demethylmenaquinone methyltransferase/2-methoxy-6-polyprenyl-1,4-benzoquinol methylase
VQTDGAFLPLPDGSVDGVTCGFALRNFTDLRATFAEMARVVRPGGRIALLEVATPPNPVLRFGHGIYFGQVVPRIGAALSDGDAYRYLPRSVAYLPEPDEMLAMLAELGFTHVRRTLLSVGISQLISATRGDG